MFKHERDTAAVSRLTRWEHSPLRRCTGFSICAAVVVCLVFTPGPVPAGSQLVPCDPPTDEQEISSALRQIERTVDPCGESAEISEVLATLRGCARATYQICTSTEIVRNVFDRPIGLHGEVVPGRIRWSPVLRSDLEEGCGGDPVKRVARDPIASLLHELVHAAQDCRGLNPGEHELEAVRIENIYRRAAGLCQRTRYGEDVLPPQLTKDCVPGHCTCSTPADTGNVAEDPPAEPENHRAGLHRGEGVSTVSAADR